MALPQVAQALSSAVCPVMGREAAHWTFGRVQWVGSVLVEASVGDEKAWRLSGPQMCPPWTGQAVNPKPVLSALRMSAQQRNRLRSESDTGPGMRLRRGGGGGLRAGVGGLERRFGGRFLVGTPPLEGRWGRTEAAGADACRPPPPPPKKPFKDRPALPPPPPPPKCGPGPELTGT